MDLSIEVEDIRIICDEIRIKSENIQIGQRNYSLCTLDPSSHLSPLLDVLTGVEIPAFPATLGEISNLNGFEAVRILRALQQPRPALLSEMRERIRRAAMNQLY
ncbi:hypothetical protein B0T25DRAFT_528432 [Lasiosphaeria hispida]|uniref:Uncharacterized protein n=1 Tax=Lasiosphaeria hispida TaxID=260671 RepID=A0AAJ0HW41_9PEZI|nr:hypothetical protein B0T25DRAFT_528432 [Lasiosphaeria hispida]